MPTVRINTSDVSWIERHQHGTGGDLIAYGTDIKGVMYFTTPVQVNTVEHVKFAGAAMIRFDLGPDAPRDHNRWAMYPESYLVSEEGEHQAVYCHTCESDRTELNHLTRCPYHITEG